MMHSNKLPYVICEAANSHGGSEPALGELIDRFAKLDYVNKGIKFQVFGADTIALPDFNWYLAYKELEFDRRVWKSLLARAAEHGDVWIDIFDLYSVDIAAGNLDKVTGLKLQPSVLENREISRALREIGIGDRKLIINVSGFGIDRISEFIHLFAELSTRLVLQVGFQAYPTEIHDAALQKIPVLKAAFPDIPLAMADHADGSSDFAQLVPIYASLLGCSILEKHFCLDRAKAKYDGYSALHPDEMQLLCNRLKDASAARSGGFIGASEREYLDKTIQVPVLKEALKEGELVHLDNLKFRRTAQQGVSWQAIDQIQRAHRVLARPVASDTTLKTSDFRPANVAAVVACRMKSSRLHKKAILSIAGISSVERCLYQCLAMRGIKQVVLATSTLDEDSVLEAYRCEGRAEFWRGDPDDVIARYVGACDHFGIDVVVRITADCPVISTEIVAHLLDCHFASGADYTTAAVAAVGTAGEIINVSALRKVIALLGKAEHSEYMTWYFRNNPDHFRINIVDLPSELVRDYRLTLDHPEDLELFEAVMRKVESADKHVPLAEVFRVLDSHPEIAALNSHIQLKYRVDQDLIAMLNEKTRIPTRILSDGKAASQGGH